MDWATAPVYAFLFLSLYFEVFLLMTFLEKGAFSKQKQITRESLADDLLPHVAIFVPCFNEQKTVGNTLRSLLALEYPKAKFEIIAVDDGSTDNTYNVLREFENHEQVHVLQKKNGGKHSAMNEALKHTDADIIGCLDADSFVAPSALRYIAEHFTDPTVAAVTPSIKVHNAKGLVQTIQKAEYSLSIFIRKVFSLLDAVFITPGPFSFFRRSAIEHVGLWRHAHSTEDLEMGLRLQKYHYKIENEPLADVYTTAPANLAALFRQRVRWTYGFLKNAVDYRFMFFNTDYGNLGLAILPVSLFSVASALYVFGLLFWNVGVFFTEQFIKFQTVGVSVPAPQFDVFYVSTSTMLSVTLVLVVLTVALMIIGKRLARDKLFTADMPIYLMLYGFIAPSWLATAVFKAVTSTGVKWR